MHRVQQGAPRGRIGAPFAKHLRVRPCREAPGGGESEGLSGAPGSGKGAVGGRSGRDHPWSPGLADSWCLPGVDTEIMPVGGGRKTEGRPGATRIGGAAGLLRGREHLRTRAWGSSGSPGMEMVPRGSPGWASEWASSQALGYPGLRSSQEVGFLFEEPESTGGGALGSPLLSR